MELLKCKECEKESPASLGYCHFCDYASGAELREPEKDKKSKKK